MRSRWLAILSSAALAALSTLLAPPRARAHDNGLYISLKYGTTDVDASFGDAFDQVVDGDDDSQTIEAGYRWSPLLRDPGRLPRLRRGARVRNALQRRRRGLHPDRDADRGGDHGVFALVRASVPLGKRLSVFGKVGAIALETEVSDESGIGDFFDDFYEEDVIWGAGLRLQIFGPIQIFYEYEGVGEDFETQSFGATWQF